MHEVTAVRDVSVEWRLMSLRMLNEGTPGYDPAKATGHTYGLRAQRVAVAARDERGIDPGDVYSALGTLLHAEKRPRDDETLVEALASLGAEDLIDKADDESYDAALRAEHDEGVTLVGNDVGTPIIAVDGAAIFGPVVSPTPRGDDAGRLWDGLRLVLATDGFFELKRGRDRDPMP
jgi:hypothetical protein